MKIKNRELYKEATLQGQQFRKSSVIYVENQIRFRICNCLYYI